LTLGVGFTPSFVGQLGLRYKSIKHYNYDSDGQLIKMQLSLKSDNAYYTSLFFNLRYDTRNSFINPSDGFYASGDVELANLNTASNVNFIKWSSVIQYYSTV
jgi:outer membrane protein assembly factor BamA